MHILSTNIPNRLELIKNFGNDYELKHIIEISGYQGGCCQYSIETIIEVFALNQATESIKIPVSTMVFYDTYSFGEALDLLKIDKIACDDFKIGIIPAEWFDTVDII